jgi:hypothetical protein
VVANGYGSDGLPTYIKAFKKEFSTLKNPRTPHIRKPRFVDRTTTLVGRLNGTVKERDKVMRGLKTEESAQVIMDCVRNYYNFIGPYQSLNGKTPAQNSEHSPKVRKKQVTNPNKKGARTIGELFIECLSRVIYE